MTGYSLPAIQADGVAHHVEFNPTVGHRCLDGCPASGGHVWPEERAACICPRFSDTGGFRIADLCCPVHGVGGTEPGDGYWEESR